MLHYAFKDAHWDRLFEKMWTFKHLYYTNYIYRCHMCTDEMPTQTHYSNAKLKHPRTLELCNMYFNSKTIKL